MSNLLKYGVSFQKLEDALVIDSNGRIAKRIEELAEKMQNPENAGFVSGLRATSLDVEKLTLDNASGDGFSGNVWKAGVKEDPQDILTQAKKEAERILKEAQEEANRVKANAKAQAEKEKGQVLNQAREKGYREGSDKAAREAAVKQRELANKERQLQAAYEQQLKELEPQFISTITGIYEHIFHVDLESYREILIHLISTTIHKVESSKEFLIHVSKEDYPYVSMQKKQIAANATSPGSTVEIVEDTSLGKNECLIETDGGIFNCGLSIQLTELGQKLRLLSYEK